MAQDIDKANNLWDLLFSEAGDAIGDIRDKLVLEPWFGRTITDGPKAADRFAQELGWVKGDDAPDTPGVSPDLGHDLDR